MLISLSRSRPFFDRNVSPDTLFIELRGPDNARDVRLPIHYINIPLYKLHPIEFVIHLVSFIWYFPLCHMDMAWQKDCYMFPYSQCNWTFVCQSYFLKICITFWQFTSIIYQRLHILLNKALTIRGKSCLSVGWIVYSTKIYVVIWYA